MDCPHIPEIGYGEFSRRLFESIKGRRIPIIGSIELTYQCNLRCVHCYAAHGHQGIPGQHELTSSEIANILDQMVDEGTLWLLLTGGEPLVRPDFEEIYISAKRKGLLPTLFTNGTLLTPRIADLLAEWKPQKVEMTLYGGTQETYERITGIPGSFKRCMQAIDLLLERGIRLKLKTMVMSLNKHELWDIKDFSESLGVDFRFDAMMNAGLQGSEQPLNYRLTPEEVVALDMADRQRMEDWHAFCDRYTGILPDPRYLYHCGAGLNTFHIDPYGKMSVCLSSREPEYDLRNGSFHEGWHDALWKTRTQPASADYQCSKCSLISLCGQCPGWGKLEHGDPEKPVDFLCQVAHLRAKALGIEYE